MKYWLELSPAVSAIPSSMRSRAGRHLRNFLSCLNEQQYSAATMARKIATLRSFHRWMDRRNLIGSNPMTLMFCPANDLEGNEKDTLRNAKPTSEGGTGEFAVCVATSGIIKKVAVAAEPLPPGESEYELAELTPIPCESIKPPRVKESPVCFECETMQVIRTNPGAPSIENVRAEIARWRTP